MVPADAAPPVLLDLRCDDHVSLLECLTEGNGADEQADGLAELREGAQFTELRAELLAVPVAGIAGEDQHRQRNQTSCRPDRVWTDHRNAPISGIAVCIDYIIPPGMNGVL